MSDEFKEKTFGKTLNVVLGDGNTYIAREPRFIDTCKLDLLKPDDMFELYWLVFKRDNPSINKEELKDLLTLGIANEIAPKILELCGMAQAAQKN